MKNIHLIVLVILGLFFQNNLQAQYDKKVKLYKTWISLNQQPYKVNGTLYDVRDSSILVSSSLSIKDYNTNNFEVTDISVFEIKNINVRKKNKVGKSALIGAAVGITVGAIAGYSMGDDESSGPWDLYNYSAEQNALGGAVAGGIIGAGLGAAIGLIKVKIPINGSMDNYHDNKAKLREYSLIRE